jgi:hypothetical protein
VLPQVLILLKVLEVPGEEVRPRYKVNFFNNNDISFVALSGLYDFVEHFK